MRPAEGGQTVQEGGVDQTPRVKAASTYKVLVTLVHGLVHLCAFSPGRGEQACRTLPLWGHQ